MKDIQRLGDLTADLTTSKIPKANALDAALEPLRRDATTAVDGEELLLATLGRHIDRAGALLRQIADAGEGEHGPLIDELDAVLDSVEWELVDTYLQRLARKSASQADRIRDLRQRLERAQTSVAGLREPLQEANGVQAPVVLQQEQVRKVEALVAQAELAQRDRNFLDLDTIMGELDRELKEAEALEQEIRARTRAAERIYGKTTLRLMVGERRPDGDHQYSLTLSRPPSPGVLGTSDEDSTALTPQNRVELGEFVKRASDQVVNHATRAAGRSTAHRATQPTEEDAPAGRDAPGPPTPAEMRKLVVEGAEEPPEIATDVLRAIGDEMFCHFVPRHLREPLRKNRTALSIQTNELELPWEFLYDAGAGPDDGDDAGGDDPDLDRFLCLSRPVAREPMGTAAHAASQTRRRRSGSHQMRFLLLLSNHRGDLAEARAEIDTIAAKLEEAWGDQIAIERPEPAKVTGKFVRSALRSPDYDVIHYAGHAHFDAENPSKSGLLLKDDEPLYAETVDRLLAGQPLVFLNACETAITANSKARDIRFGLERPAEGLVTSFVRGGAIGCIGSLWPIYDDAAAEFAARFYNLVLEGHMIGEALRQARIYIKAKFPKRVTWAAYAMFGDPTQQLFDW